MALLEVDAVSKDPQFRHPAPHYYRDGEIPSRINYTLPSNDSIISLTKLYERKHIRNLKTPNLLDFE